jgi:hypothetical protein
MLDELLLKTIGPRVAPLSFADEVFLCVNEVVELPELIGMLKEIIRSVPPLTPWIVSVQVPFFLLEFL